MKQATAFIELSDFAITIEEYNAFESRRPCGADMPDETFSAVLPAGAFPPAALPWATRHQSSAE